MKKPIRSCRCLALAGILAGLLGGGAPGASADANAVYQTNCKMCHGVDGKGDTPMGRMSKITDWTTPAFQKKVSDADIVKAILNGAPGSGGHNMPSMKDKVSAADAQALVKVVRGFGK